MNASDWHSARMATLSCRSRSAAAGNLGRLLGRDLRDSMSVGVDQVARRDLEPAHAHRHVELEDVRVGVGRHDRSGEALQAERTQLRQLPDGAVRDDPDHAERVQHVALQGADQGADAWLRIRVLEHHDPRRGAARMLIHQSRRSPYSEPTIGGMAVRIFAVVA